MPGVLRHLEEIVPSIWGLYCIVLSQMMTSSIFTRYWKSNFKVQCIYFSFKTWWYILIILLWRSPKWCWWYYSAKSDDTIINYTARYVCIHVWKNSWYYFWSDYDAQNPLILRIQVSFDTKLLWKWMLVFLWWLNLNNGYQ